MYKQEYGNKYNARSQIYNGSTYHSKLEAGYAQALDAALQSGEIKSWEKQVRLEICIDGKKWADYYIDFVVYHLDGSREFVECKGLELAPWRLKWKALEIVFDKQFKEHPDDSLTVVKQTSWGPPKPRWKK